MRQLQTLGIFAAGYLARPIGGHFDCPFWRHPGPQEDVHAVGVPDGRAHAGHRPAADL